MLDIQLFSKLGVTKSCLEEDHCYRLLCNQMSRSGVMVMVAREAMHVVIGSLWRRQHC